LDRINSSIAAYKQNIVDAYGVELVRDLSALMDEYNTLLAQLIDYAKAGDVDAMDVLLLGIAPLASDIDARLQTMSDVGYALLRSDLDQSWKRVNNTIVLLNMVSVVSVLAILAVSIGVYYAAKKRYFA
jgi:hypothetical protein